MTPTEKEIKADSREMYSTATRTLLASGYLITNTDSHPHHMEFDCERSSRLGAMLHFRIAVTPDSRFGETTTKAVHQTAASVGRAVVLVSRNGGSEHISWAEFLSVLGGAVPSWRVLTEDYGRALMTAAENKVPANMTGEAWSIFEDLVADGFEFCFGRKVGRFGGRRRGLRVSDMIAQLPDSSLLLVDAKAYESGMKVRWPALRPLVEYVGKQKEYQKDRNIVLAAVVISSRFEQDKTALLKPASDFLGETRVPLCFISVTTLAKTVQQLTKLVDFRNLVQWKLVFTGGLIEPAMIRNVIKQMSAERFEPGVD